MIWHTGKKQVNHLCLSLRLVLPNNMLLLVLNHSQNEKYNKSNLINGVKVLGVYLHELGKLKGPKPSSCRCVELTEEELMVPGAFMRGFKCKCVM